jgi:hypothetical protein
LSKKHYQGKDKKIKGRERRRRAVCVDFPKTFGERRKEIWAQRKRV